MPDGNPSTVSMSIRLFIPAGRYLEATIHTYSKLPGRRIELTRLPRNTSSDEDNSARLILGTNIPDNSGSSWYDGWLTLGTMERSGNYTIALETPWDVDPGPMAPNFLARERSDGSHVNRLDYYVTFFVGSRKNTLFHLMTTWPKAKGVRDESEPCFDNDFSTMEKTD